MLWLAAVFLGVFSAGRAAAQTRRTVWDGVFTAEQAARGRMIIQQRASPVIKKISAAAGVCRRCKAKYF